MERFRIGACFVAASMTLGVAALPPLAAAQEESAGVQEQTPPAPETAQATDNTPAPVSEAAQGAAADLPTIPVEDSSSVKLDEVVVTAQKRVQRLVDVPINVSSMNRDEVRTTRIEQVRDVAAYIPNLDIKEQVPGGIPVVSIRGVGLDDFSSTNSPAAGIYVDQVTLSSLALMSFDLYDIERLEVLKGPQGTLYGRNSTAGAINVLSARPIHGNEAYLKAGFGSYKTSDFEGMINLPLGGDLAFRLAGKYIRQDEGYWKSRRSATDTYDEILPIGGGLLPILGGGLGLPLPPLALQRDTRNDPIVRDVGERDIVLGRARLAWDATMHLHFDLKVEGQRQRSEMGQPEMFGTYCQQGASPIDPDRCTDALGYSDRDRDPYKGDWRGEFPYTIDQLGETLTADWDLGGATLTSVTGYIDLDRFFHIDVDGTPANEFDFFQADTVKQLTQELRLGGTGDWVDWLVGAFGSKDKVTVHTDGRHDDLVPTETSTIDADQDTRSWAAFANGDWHLSKRLSLVTGLRYTHETRDYVGGTDWSLELPGQISDTHIDAAIADNNWSWRLGLNFQPTRKSLVYANASKGVKSGGFFSGVTNDQVQLQPYKPEELIAYEIGAKTQGKLAFNTSAFYYDYTDVQTFMRSSTAPVQLIGNVEEARTYGADLESVWRAFDGLTLRGGVGLLRTRLGSFIGPSGAPIPEGNKLANAPELTFTGLARYEIPVFSTGALAAIQGDAHYSDGVFKEATNDPLIAAEPYWIYNARLSLVSAQRSWEIALWGRNLTDELYVVQGLDIGAFFFGNRNYNAPRTFGFEFTVSF
jgi:iron complex outermembrane receptor protein